MNNEQINNLVVHIQARIVDLERELFPQNAPDGESEGSQDVEEKLSEAINTHIRDKSRQELIRLRTNLDWLRGDDAGLCESCSEPIPYERLRVVPITRLCVHCAE